MRRLVSSILGTRISLNTSIVGEIAFFRSDGHVIVRVRSIGSDPGLSRQKINIKVNLKYLRKRDKSNILEERTSWKLPKSAIPVQKGDLVCLFGSASYPSIIRPCSDHFIVVMIAAVPSENGQISFVEKFRSKEIFPLAAALQEFSLVWAWKPVEKGASASRWYSDSLHSSYRGLTLDGLERRIKKIMRVWNVADIYRGIGEFGLARNILKNGIEGFEWAFKTKLSHQKAITQNGKELNVWEESNIWESMSILLWAALEGREDVVKVLLATGKVDFNSKDELSTALWWAASNGRDKVTRLLLETGKTTIDRNFLPLLYNAATFGYLAIAQLLLEFRGDDINGKFIKGRTALSQASRKGHYEVFMLLLKTGQSDLDSRDEDGRTPLSLAAGHGHDKIFEQLLETGKVNVNTKDGQGRTPLAWAMKYGHEGIVKRLLDVERVDVNAERFQGWTMLSWATKVWARTDRQETT